MGRKSSIKTLPKQILAEVDRLLRDEHATIDEVVEHLKEMGFPRKRSAVGLYRQNIAKVGERMRRTQEITEALVKEMGPSAVEGKTGRLLVQILQSIVFEWLMAKTEDEAAAADLKSGDLFFLAKALKEMASAQKIDVERELKIREEAERKTKDAAVKAVEATAREKGLTKETAEAIRASILGVKVAA